jgi:hypothetical protein
MNISAEMIVFVVGLTLLGLLFTGPGMWSERWGWRWFRRRDRGGGEPKPPDDRAR